MVPYICLCKTVCDLSYRCIWYPIFVYISQCVTCLIYVYGTLYFCKRVCDLSYRCIWYPILVYVRECVNCLVDVYGTLYWFMQGSVWLVLYIVQWLW